MQADVGPRRDVDRALRIGRRPATAQDRRALDTLAAQAAGRAEAALRNRRPHRRAADRPRAPARASTTPHLGLARAQAVGRVWASAVAARHSLQRAVPRPDPAGDRTGRATAAHWPTNRRVEVRVYWEETAPLRGRPLRLGAADRPHRMPGADADRPGRRRHTRCASPSTASRRTAAPDQAPTGSAAWTCASNATTFACSTTTSRSQAGLSAAARPTGAVPGEVTALRGVQRLPKKFIEAAPCCNSSPWPTTFTRRCRWPPSALDADLRGEWTGAGRSAAALRARRRYCKLYWRLRRIRQGRPVRRDAGLFADARATPPAGGGRRRREEATGQGVRRKQPGGDEHSAARRHHHGQRPGHPPRRNGCAPWASQSPSTRTAASCSSSWRRAARRAPRSRWSNADGEAHVLRRDLELPKTDWFFVGQADLTIGRDRTTGPAPLVSQRPRTATTTRPGAKGAWRSTARGNLDERWQLTASVDTEERELGDLFRNLDRKDPSVAVPRASIRWIRGPPSGTTRPASRTRRHRAASTCAWTTAARKPCGATSS